MNYVGIATEQRGAVPIGCAGAPLILVVLVLCLLMWSCTRAWFHSTRREPALPTQKLLDRQLEVFPADWVLSRPEIITHQDSTWAEYAIHTYFEYKRGINSVSEEIHVFRSPRAAWMMPHPSPGSLGIGDGQIPEDWTYRPLHADRFEFSCGVQGTSAWPRRCGALIRYEEYIIEFSAPLADYFTLQDFQRLLEVTDREMHAYLPELYSSRRGPRAANRGPMR